jgi:hypothetical protein
MKKIITLTLLVSIAYCSAAQETLPAFRASSDSLKKHLYFLASDSLKGRSTGSKGQKIAAAYIAARFKDFGLTPIRNNGENPYYQSFSRYRVPLSHSDVQLSIKGTPAEVRYLNDLLLLSGKGIANIELTPYLGRGSMLASSDGYAPVIAAQTFDEGLRRIVGACKGDVKGNFFLVLPTSKLVDFFHSRFVFSVHLRLSTNQAGDTLFSAPFRLPILAKENVYYTKVLPLLARYPNLNIVLTDELFLKKVFSKDMLAGYPNVQKNSIGKALVIKGCYAGDVLERGRTENVVGVFEGTSKKEEAIIICAHYDHIDSRSMQGILIKPMQREAVSSSVDSIFNGADDNASGTSAILEVARLIAQAKKEGYSHRRTIIVTAFTAEEVGLEGSQYMADHPIYPFSKIKLVVNLDMVGRTNEIHTDTSMYVYPLVLGKPAASLNGLLNQSATMAKVDISSSISDKERKGWANGSDHAPFVKKGIPAIALTTGIHPDYHTPADEASKISYPRLTRISSFAFHTVWMLANE